MFNRLRGQKSSPYAKQPPLKRGAPAIKGGPGTALAVSEELRSAYKSLSYSQYVQDFINETGQYGAVYSDQQLESSYRVSVYLFAALRRVANLTREVKIVAEARKGDEWVRMPETHPLNTIFRKAGARFFYEAYLYYAIYGRVLIYKRKTRKGVYSAAKQKYLNLLEGGVSGLHIIPNFNWTMIEDATTGEITEFLINTEDVVVGDRRSLAREEVAFIKDFDPRILNGSVSMVSLAINDAISNAAISRWAAHYFMSGAMPLLLVSSEDDPALQTEADIAQYKSLIERAWQGVMGRFSMRAVYTDRKLNVQTAGIDADKVQAPEIDRSALSKIASAVQIAPDLIVPPEGGTQERHIQLIQAAYRDAVLPVMQHFVDGLNYDLGLDDSKYRYVIDESQISALNAERKILAETELQIYNAGLMSYGEAQERLRQTPDEDFADWFLINGSFKSKSRILRDDALVPADSMQYLQQAWDGDALLRSEYRRFLGLQTPPSIPDGFKSQLTQQTAIGTDISGQANLPTSPDLPPSPPPQLPDGGGSGGQPTPLKPSPKPNPGNQAATPPKQEAAKPEGEKPKPEDGDKTVEYVSVPDNERPVPASTVTSANTLTTGNSVTVVMAGGPPGPVLQPLPDPPAPPAMPVEPGNRVTTVAALPSHNETGSEPVGAPLSVWLDLSGDPLLQTVRLALESALGADAAQVTWTDPARYKAVLSESAQVTDEQARLIAALLPGHVEDFDLRVVQTDAEYGDGESLLIALLEGPAPLATLQDRVRKAFSTYRQPVADGDLVVVLGTAPGDLYVPELVFESRCVPDRVVVSRADDVPLRVIPSIRNWRETLGDHYEPDGTDIYSQNPNALANWEEWMHDIQVRRRAMLTAIDEWKADGRTERLPEPLRGAISELRPKLPDDLIERAAREAVRSGWFDEEAGAAENPILMLIRATAKALKAAPDDDGDGIPDTDDSMLEEWVRRLGEIEDPDVKSLMDDDGDDEEAEEEPPAASV